MHMNRSQMLQSMAEENLKLKAHEDELKKTVKGLCDALERCVCGCPPDEEVKATTEDWKQHLQLIHDALESIR